jgi:hypothetical protein
MIEQSPSSNLAPDEPNAFANPQSIGDAPCGERNGAAASGRTVPIRVADGLRRPVPSLPSRRRQRPRGRRAIRGRTRSAAAGRIRVPSRRRQRPRGRRAVQLPPSGVNDGPSPARRPGTGAAVLSRPLGATDGPRPDQASPVGDRRRGRPSPAPGPSSAGEEPPKGPRRGGRGRLRQLLRRRAFLTSSQALLLMRGLRIRLLWRGGRRSGRRAEAASGILAAVPSTSSLAVVFDKETEGGIDR